MKEATTRPLPDDLGGADPREMKAAMAQLAKATIRVLRAANPGRDFSGAFKEVGPRANGLGGLEIVGAGDKLFLRAGTYEVELYPVVTEEDEEELLGQLAAKKMYRERALRG